MTFDEVLTQVLDLLQREKRVSYRALKRRFDVDDDYLEDLKDELIYAKKLATDEDDRVLVWIGETASAFPPASVPDEASTQERQPPISYTPPYLTEKILTSRTALEGERKQVTVLFADLKGSMELLADRDPEEARQLLDPVLERLMAAVHRYEGTVNQIMGDGIMALFGAPIAHEDHAVRACYAALVSACRKTLLRAMGCLLASLLSLSGAVFGVLPVPMPFLLTCRPAPDPASVCSD
jgi:hypothetical protein